MANHARARRVLSCLCIRGGQACLGLFYYLTDEHCQSAETTPPQCIQLISTFERFNDWGGRGYDVFVLGEVTKTAPSGDRTT